ncbi:MAG: hypothetical protein WAZ34_15490 [Rhodocyclaceae bacterium]
MPLDLRRKNDIRITCFLTRESEFSDFQNALDRRLWVKQKNHSRDSIRLWTTLEEWPLTSIASRILRAPEHFSARRGSIPHEGIGRVAVRFRAAWNE